MNEELKKAIVEVFQRNVENRLSIELCNGMVQSIFEVVAKIEGEKNGNSDLSNKAER